MKRPKKIYKNYFFNFGFVGKDEFDDFILLPVPACGITRHRKNDKSIAVYVAIKYGYWGLFFAIFRMAIK